MPMGDELKEVLKWEVGVFSGVAIFLLKTRQPHTQLL